MRTRNIIIYAESEERAEALKMELIRVAHQINILGAYHDIKVMKEQNKYEEDAIYFVDIIPDRKKILDFIASLKIGSRTITCHISDDKEHIEILKKNKIYYIKSPVILIDIIDILKRNSTKNHVFDEDLPAQVKKIQNFKTGKIKAAYPSLMVPFKIKKNLKRFNLNLIVKIYRNKDSHKVYLVFIDGMEVEIDELITDVLNRLQQYGIQIINRREGLNLLYINEISINGKQAFMNKEVFPIDPIQHIAFGIAWDAYNIKMKRG